MKNNFHNRKAGFTLVETFVAITILAFALVGPLNIAANSILSALYAKDEVTAFYLAQEGFEYVRNVRDSNNHAGLTGAAWLTGLSLCMSGVRGCVIDSVNNTIQSYTYCGLRSCPLKYANGVYSYTSGVPDSIFTRTIKINSTSADAVEIYVTVSWKTGTLASRTVTLKETMLNWEL